MINSYNVSFLKKVKLLLSRQENQIHTYYLTMYLFPSDNLCEIFFFQFFN